MSRPVDIKASIERFGKDLAEVFAANRMVIFLCGPSIARKTKGALLRKKLKELLEKEGFEVVLGEDDGLEMLRKQFKGVYAHDNELQFIKKECNAIVLIADSVGSYCELGLFAHVHSREDTNRRDLLVIINRKYKKATSYLNEGPAKAAKHFGVVYYDDFGTFDTADLLERLRGRRASYFFDGRGRPAKAR